MKATGFLFLATLLFVVLTKYASCLRPGGRNVLTRYVTTSVRLTSARKHRIYRTTRSCTKTCTWSCCNCRRCRYMNVFREEYRTFHYYVTRYKPLYYCANGWSPSGDECTIPICTGKCANGGRCISPETCQCSFGWQGSKCRTDINECMTNNGGCQQHCTNWIGNYNCSCDPGYNLNGRRCPDIDECVSNKTNTCEQVCVNRPGNYSCDCFAGYQLIDNSTCSDIDECSKPICQYQCNNTIGSFLCSCPSGYLLTSNKRDCADHDECKTGNHTCEQRCINHPGGYTCTCHPGFSLNSDNRTCSDIDECKSNVDGCAYQCQNMIGSFKCFCAAGFYLNPDNRTCSDHDECKNGQHTCSQICGNTPGSYYCMCQPGYYLDSNFRTCKGYPCSSITKPANGHMNCTGNTMDSVCQFSCEPGYELVGPQLRMCLSRGQWSGSRAFCKIKHCNRPKPPAHGYVQIPCLTNYKGKCSFGCSPGYFLNGSRTVACSADSKWVPIPGRCDAITVCHPNPCFHGGTCHPTDSTDFWCNCTNTVRTGSRCQVGIFRTPKYPRLKQNDIFNVTFELSPPKDKLIIQTSAAGLDFDPQTVVITPSQIKQGKIYLANMTVKPRVPGIHQITYTLSGPSASSYQAVLPSTVIVLKNGASCNNSLETSFPLGCYEIRLLKCPVTDDILYVRSTESWHRSGSQISTNGVATILSGDLKVPLGMQGATLDKMNDSRVTLAKGPCQHTLPRQTQCLASETLATVFLQSLNDSLPSWFRMIPSKTLSSLGPSDVITYIWTGAELKTILTGLGLSIDDKAYYSVLLYTGAVTVEVNQSGVHLPKYGKNSFLVVAVELCPARALPAKVIVVFDPFSYDALSNMSFYRQLATQGWNVSALALQFSKYGGLSYSVNSWMKGSAVIHGNVEVYGRLERSFAGLQQIRSLGVQLVGNAIAEIPNTNKAWVINRDSWTAGVRGEVAVFMKFLLLNQWVPLEIELDQSSGQIQFQELVNSTSCQHRDSYKLFLSGLLRENPFASDPLASYIEGSKSNVSLFVSTHSVNESSSNNLPGPVAMHVSLYLNGTVKFGPLVFPNVSIQTELSSGDFKRCDSHKEAPGLKLTATFHHHKALGAFFTSSNSDSVQILLPSEGQNTTFGILNTTVALLGDYFQTEVRLSNGSLSFEKEFDLFDTYRLFVKGSSSLQPWDYLILRISGAFGKPKPNNGHGILEISLRQMIENYIKVVVENTVQRMRSLQNITDKMNKRIEKSKFRLANIQKNSHIAVTRYLWALRAQQAALRDVHTAERNVSNSTQELQQIKASFERLCSITVCPYVCVTGTACNTCYKDLMSREQGLCPAICHKVLIERIPPYEVMDSCSEQNCDLKSSSHRLIGVKIPSAVSCSFEKVGKSVLTVAAKSAVTYGLASIGVPPNIACNIAERAATYAVTKSPDKALHSRVEAGVKAKAEAVVAARLVPSMNEQSMICGGFKGIKDGMKNAYHDCNDEGGWDCSLKSHPCPKPLYNYKFTNKPYSCEMSCEVNVIKETIATPCCKAVNCALRVRDLSCTERNAFCRIARDKAFFKLNTAKRNLVEPLVKLQRAKKKLSVAEIELSKQKIGLEAATSERETLRKAHEALVKAANISRRSNELNRASIQDAISLARLWNSTNETSPIDIKEISFNVALASPSETSIPVSFTVKTKAKEKTIVSVLNFASLNDSLQQTAKQIVKEFFGNVSVVLRSGHPLNQVSSTQHKARRRRRSVDDGDSDVVPLIEFKRKCALVTNYQIALADIIGLLNNISTESLQHHDTATNNTTGKLKHAERKDFTLNRTHAGEFGLSDKDVDDAIQAVPSDEAVFHAAGLIDFRNATNHNKVRIAMEVVYRDWEASMQSVFNCTSLECSGFIDCMEDFVDNLVYLYQDVKLTEAVRYRRKLIILATEVKNLLSVEDPSLAEASKRSSAILTILRNIKNEKVFCAIPPNITDHPEATMDLKTGQTLELHCKATGDPVPFYRWKRNGVFLPGSNTENLRIENVAASDSGNYSCEAHNHVSVESSSPSHVLVHSPPVLVYQPPRKLNVPINSGFYLRCNATSVARPLRYQWLFKPSSARRDDYTVIPNGNYSVLKFSTIPKYKEGFYLCNASNPFDYILSDGVQVRVLGLSLAVPSLGLSFEMNGDNNQITGSYGGWNKADNGGKRLLRHENFQEDVQVSFTRAVNELVNLSSNAVQNLTVRDCKAKNKGNNITCSVSFRLNSLNVTGPESRNRTERENAVSVMDSVKQLRGSAAVLLNETANGGIRFNVKDTSLEINPGSWSVGEYMSLCPIGSVLYVNNFMCVNCPPGTYGFLNGTSPACYPCAFGTYQPGQGHTSCKPCPPGSSSRGTGLENLSSCKVNPSTETASPPTVESSQTPRSTEGSPTETTPEEKFEKISTEKPGAKKIVGKDEDVAAKWKLAFGVCVAIIIIFLVGVIAHAVNHRIKKTGRFKTVEKSDKANNGDQTFQNPIYDVNEVVEQKPVYGHDNPVYQIEEPLELESKM